MASCEQVLFVQELFNIKTHVNYQKTIYRLKTETIFIQIMPNILLQVKASHSISTNITCMWKKHMIGGNSFPLPSSTTHWMLITL